MGREDVMSAAERYEGEFYPRLGEIIQFPYLAKTHPAAHEYMDLVYQMWEGCWEDGAQIWDPEKGAYDPTKIHKLEFNGKYHKMSGTQQTHPSPVSRCLSIPSACRPG